MVAPWWESSQEGAELMLRYGLEYDHSFSHHDCQCYWLRTGDEWTPIDYKKHPEYVTRSRLRSFSVLSED